jgi:acyl-CoA thioester hydrolase
MKDQLKYFLHSVTVLPEHIDPNNHLNNIIYLQLMQDAAIGHVQANGVYDLTEPLGLTWFAKKHTIEYLAQSFLDDEIIVVTWVETITKISTVRKYHLYRKSDKKLLCKGKTLWIMINLEKSRPTKIPQNVMDLFWKTTDFDVEDISDLV